MPGLYRQLFSILGRDRVWIFLGLIVASVFTAALQLVSVGSVFPLMAVLTDPGAMESNEVVSGLSRAFDLQTHDQFLHFSGMVLVCAILASNAANVATIWFTQKFIAEEHVRLQDVLIQKYAYKPYIFFLSNDSTSLCRDVLAELNVFLSQFVRPLLDLIIRSVGILAIGTGLFLVNPAAAVGSCLVFGGGYLAVYLVCRRKLEELGQIRIDSEIRKFKVTWELFSGQREARLLDCRENYFDAYSDNARTQQKALLQSSLISMLPRQGIEVLGFMLVFSLVLLFRSQGQAWNEVVPLLSLYAVGAVRVMPQFQSFFASLVALQNSAPAVERLAPELEAPRQPDPPEVLPLEWDDSLEFRGLTYMYPDTDQRVLDGLNCTIAKSERVGFVGTTGAGKTTLINILLGLLSPSEGCLAVDGEPVTDENLRSWQRNIGFVPQDIFLCNDTLAGNIAFGIPSKDIDMEQVKRSATLACLAEHVDSLPEGYETRIGERGVRLSGGQRQRLGIARALYRQPTVLVLDEATSALDGQTEDDVMEAINSAGEDKTIIMIAHRLTTLKECDVIYMLEAGRIVDSGTHAELMSRNQTFQSFAKVK